MQSLKEKEREVLEGVPDLILHIPSLISLLLVAAASWKVEENKLVFSHEKLTSLLVGYANLVQSDSFAPAQCTNQRTTWN